MAIKISYEVKEEFNVDNVVYLKQIHSDKILVYKSSGESIKDEEGDAIITNEKNVIIYNNIIFTFSSTFKFIFPRSP